ncbi:hypothetical protein FRC12_012667 [Ceratobasidium sp. 428]|nr:hypothetical protein FRC12_012667 [Ceratobasidium sp. 428]
MGTWQSARSLHARDADQSGQTPSVQNLVVGIVPGIIAVLVFSGIAILLIIRRRLPSKKPTRGYYSQASTSSTDPYLNAPRGRIDWAQRGYRYDPESAYGLPSREERNPIYREILRVNTSDALLAAPRQSVVMQSATSPPPFVPYPNKQDSLPHYASQSQAELPVEKTPTRDEDSDDGSDESFISGEKGQLEDVPRTGDLGVLSTPSPIPPRLYRSPHSDDEADIEALELEITRLIEDAKQTKTDKKSYFSLPFGLSRSGTQRSSTILGRQSQALGHVPSLGRGARSGLGLSTAPPARAGEVELPPGGGSTLSSLLGRLAAPFSHTGRSRQIDSRRVTPDEQAAMIDKTGALTTSPDHVPPVKMPEQPASPFLAPPMALPSTAASLEAHPFRTAP